MLLGEKLIAFRDTAGRVGVMDHRCPHRCASLFLGRNEEGGIRCIYHGWKFDVAGNCLDMPNVPPHQDFKHKVKAKAYRAVERAGVVWVYMGSRAEGAAAAGVRDPRRARRRDQRQLHPARLQLPAGARGRDRHLAFRLPARRPRRSRRARRGRAGLPHHHQPRAGIPRRRCPLGHAVRRLPPAGGGSIYWRFANFLFPFWTQVPAGEFASHVHRGWVPLDDGHTMYCFLRWKRGVSAKTQHAARLQGRHADRRHRTRQQAPAQHHRLARPLAARRQ